MDIATKIVELRKAGTSLKQIVKQLGCSKSTVSKWCAVLIKNNDDITKKILADRHITIRNRKKEAQEMAHMITRLNTDPKRAWTIATREATKHFLLEAAGGKCQICGYNYCKACLVFHHLDESKKEFNINGMRLTYSLTKIIKEASKCALLCMNCHGEHHNGFIKELKPIDFSNIIIPVNLLQWYFNKGPMVGLEPTGDL